MTGSVQLLTSGSRFAGWLSIASAYGATDAWDFTIDRYMRASAPDASGLTVTRASDGYAETSDGVLVPFASGELRRTDRGVLVEGARTNLLLRSQEFDNAAWSKIGLLGFGSGSTANASAAPDKTTTADLITESTANNRHFTFQLVNVSASTTYTQSYYLKYATKRYCVVALKSYTGSVNVAAYSQVVDLQNRTLGAATNTVGSPTATASTIELLDDGWCRVNITMNTGTGGVLMFCSACLSDSAAPSYSEEAPFYTGDGVSGMLVWQADLQAGAFPSSLILTTGSTATRAADVVTLTAPAALVSGYTVFAQWDGSQNANGRVIDFGNSTLIRRSGGTNLNFNGAGLEGSAVGAFASGKAAIAIDAAAVRGAANGSSVTVTTGSYSSSSQTALRFGSTGTSNYLDGYIRRIAIFPSALSDAQLQAITT
jgi:hypothetical protein